jgi:8-oxo-dGTP diphosphatase
MIHVCAAVIYLNGKYLLTSRPPGKHLEGLWEFPGGKVHLNESANDCLIRELREELGVNIIPGEKLYSINYEYPEKKVFLEFFLAEPADIKEFNPYPHEGQGIRWEVPDKLCEVDWVPADLPLAEYLTNISQMKNI